MAIEAGRFICEACGKSYRWKLELAGRRIKCKCGTVMRVPAAEPGVATAATDSDDPFAVFEDFSPQAVSAEVMAINPPAPTPTTALPRAAKALMASSANPSTSAR